MPSLTLALALDTTYDDGKTPPAQINHKNGAKHTTSST